MKYDLDSFTLTTQAALLFKQTKTLFTQMMGFSDQVLIKRLNFNDYFLKNSNE